MRVHSSRVTNASDHSGPTRSEYPRSARAPARHVEPDSTASSATPRDPDGARAAIDSRERTQKALEESGIARLRVLVSSMLIVIQVGMVALALLDGDAQMKQLAWAALAALLAMFLFSWMRIEQEHAIDTREVRKMAIPTGLAVVVANFAFGLASAYSAAVTLGLLLFASSTSRRNARTAFVTILVGYVLTSLLVRFKLLPYHPILPVYFATPWQRDAGGVVVLCLYVAAYASGRRMRREMVRMVEQVEHAVREASYRDALFREARDALKQAAGLGGPGRFTDHELDGYRLGEVIGRGGMGEVYAAQRHDDALPAAVKLLRVDYLGDRAALTRFGREAAIAASIHSEHVVRVLAVSTAEAIVPYIAMERLTGADLGSYLREHGRLTLDEVADLVRQVASGLDAAHAHNVVHRDLKPSNVFRAEGEHGGAPTWKILDFGVSKLSGAIDATLTRNELVGTPQYMAPEQARGEHDLDARTDVYGLSALAYRALTGEAPFVGDFPEILQRIIEEPPPAASTRAEVPPDIDVVLRMGLAKRREHRFATASAFAVAFDQALRSELDPAIRARATALEVSP